MVSAVQIIYSAFNTRPLPPPKTKGVCRLCGGSLVGEAVLWRKRVRDSWTLEGQARCKQSAYICEACEWAYGAQAARGSVKPFAGNRGFVARLEKLKKFKSIDEILEEIAAFSETTKPAVWLLKKGKVQQTALFIPAVSYPPYLRITFLDGDAKAREIIARPEQLLRMYNELSAIPVKNGERYRFAERSPAGEFVSWLINARSREIAGEAETEED